MVNGTSAPWAGSRQLLSRCVADSWQSPLTLSPCWAPVALSLALAAGVGRAEWTTPSKVTYLNLHTQGFNFVLRDVAASCPNSSQFIVEWNTAGARQLYATMLLAYTVGDLVAVNYGCNAQGLGVTSNIDIRKS